MQPTPPCPAPTGWWQMWASVLLLYWQLWLGMYSVLFCFSSFLFFLFCWPLRFQNSPQTCLCKGFLLCGNFSSFTTSSPGWVSIPNSFVIICVFYILPYLLSKRMVCLSEFLVSSASVQKVFFVEVVAHSNHLLMNLSGRKWSPCPISLPSWDHLLQKPVSFIRLMFYYFPSQTIIFSLQL